MDLFKQLNSSSYRRKRSLLFRAKMRQYRTRVFGDAFHKQDRTFKSINKVLAAKRRQRDGKGKFNIEAVATTAALTATTKSHLEENTVEACVVDDKSSFE